MAACPSLHKLVHRDADSADHTCIATMLASGQVLSTGAPDALPIFACAVFVLVLVEILRPHFERDLRLPVGRAPPLV